MTVNPRKSFKFKLFLSVLVASLITFSLIVAATLYYTRKEIRDSVSAIVTAKLAIATKAIDDSMQDIEVASDNLIGIVNSSFVNFNLKSANVIGKSFLDVNPHIQGLCIGYEDGSMFNHPGPWCPYVMRLDGEYVYIDIAQERDFRNEDWYRTPIVARKELWSEPFRETKGTLVVSFDVPIFDEITGELICVVALDQNLNEMSDSLQTLCPYEGSSMYVVDKNGRYIAHPNHECVLTESASPELMDAIRSRADYYIDKSSGEEVYLFPQTIERTNWTVVLSVPRKAIVARQTRMMNSIMAIMILGILLLLSGAMFVIHHVTKPLEQFAEAAKQVSHGKFKVDLPVIKDHNELYDLRAALASMSVSLDTYIHKLEDTTAKKAAMDRELNIARDIQMAMLPTNFPPYPNFDNLDVFASLSPAQAVGGDLYDFVLCGDKFFFCIADVSGKGVPASLLMSITRTLFRSMVSPDKTPSQIASGMNDAIEASNEMGLFVTMVIASFDVKTGDLRICNCGHNLPTTNGRIVDPKSMKATPDAPWHLINGLKPNIALGVVPGFEYTEVMMNITPGCMIVLYTDGVTECENSAKELYQESRLLECLASVPEGSSCKEYVERVIADVKAFEGDAPQSDDVTILCIRCNHLS